jgi:DNA-binding Lrp family transcriptional regulator
VKVYLLINCVYGHEVEVFSYLKETLPEAEVDRVFGPYDIMMSIHGKDAETIKEIITWKVRKHDGIKSMLSLLSTTTELVDIV